MNKPYCGNCGGYTQYHLDNCDKFFYKLKFSRMKKRRDKAYNIANNQKIKTVKDYMIISSRKVNEYNCKCQN